MAPAGKAALVEQVKGLQRQSPDLKQAWWDFCDDNLEGIRDPNRQEEGVLKQFLAMHKGAVGSGGGGAGPARPSSWKGGGGGAYVGGSKAAGGKGFGASWPSMPMGMGMGMPMQPMFYGPPPGYGGGFPGAGGQGSELVQFIKNGQRHSKSWKGAWQAYCKVQGDGINDPSRHGDEYITGFMDYVGQCVEAQLGAEEGLFEEGAAPQVKPTLQKRGRSDGVATPAAKRRKVEDDMDPDKAALVGRVKDFQRKDQASKELWWSFTDENHGGVHDPAKHDAPILQEFLEMHDQA